MRPHLWVFGFEGLPHGQHFTLAKNSKSGINFHITKNIADKDNPNKKPCIPILEIDKEIIESDLSSLFLTMFFGMLNEIDIEDIKNKSELIFLSFEDLENDNTYKENRENLFKEFKDVSKIEKKSRLKVSEEWTEKLVKLTESEKMMDLINRNSNEFRDSQPKDIDGGILISDDKVLSVIKVYNKWFELSTDKKPIEMFKQVIDERLAKFIWYNIKRSIIILKSVNSWKETENIYKPITIVKNK